MVPQVVPTQLACTVLDHVLPAGLPWKYGLFNRDPYISIILVVQ